MITKVGSEVPGYLNMILTAVIMASVIVILFDAIPKWYQVIRGIRPIVLERAAVKQE